MVTQININIPPKEGEHGYFDPKLAKNNVQVLKYKRTHWLIETDSSDTFIGCHYSTMEKQELDEDSIKYQGIVKNIKK
tara:strand:- start:66 stop:299 length:234 start_codon:yes stop_codon:yes gene_type:complete